MSKSFFVVDKLNVVAKECFPLVRFKYDNSEYLIYYSISDDNSNCEVFVSKLFKRDGVYKFSSVDSELVSVFGGLVRDILELPSSYTKDSNINQLFSDFSESHGIEFLERFPILTDQDSDGSPCLINMELEYVKYVYYFYSNALPRFKKQVYISKPAEIVEEKEVPVQNDVVSQNTSVWEVPSDNNDNMNSSVPVANTASTTSDFFAAAEGASFNQADDSNVINSYAANYSFISPSVPSTFENQENNNYVSNSNVAPGGFVYGTSNGYYNNVTPTSYNYGNNVNNAAPVQNNMPLASQNAGYASSKYVIVGTICLILASLIVAISIVVVNRL